MAETKFSELAHLGERMEKTTKRLGIVALIAQFLQSLSPEEIAPGGGSSSARTSPSRTAAH